MKDKIKAQLISYREDLFLEAFEAAGFHGIQIEQRQAEPWRIVEGLEFRSITVSACKGKQGPDSGKRL